MLEALEEAPEGLSTRELEATVNLGNAGIGKTIELLSLESPESPTPLAKLDGRWQLTAAPLHDRPRPSAQGRAGSADRRAEDASLRLHDRLAGRFDEAMDRIAGWYMRRVALLIFAIAAAVTVAANASTIHVAAELWRNAALGAAITAQASAAAEHAAAVPLDALAHLGTLPIGWHAAPDGVAGWLKTLLGWLMTIAAVSLGAPFWFDLLGKLAHLRAAGAAAPRVRPADGTGSSASRRDTPPRHLP